MEALAYLAELMVTLGDHDGMRSALAGLRERDRITAALAAADELAVEQG